MHKGKDDLRRQFYLVALEIELKMIRQLAS